MLKKIFQQAIPATSEHNLNLSGLMEQQYNYQVAQGHIQSDAAQYQAIQHLQTLLENLLAHVDYENRSAAQKLIFAAPEKCRNLYIFGDVGRGKSMLMGLFFEVCPVELKRRVHFHAFMQEVHEFTFQWRQQNEGDVISALATKIRDSAVLLCFDEFHVSDIADAMILGRLFSKLFELGVIVVFTSNRKPNDLYQGGLLREQFLPFINLLLETSEIIELAAEQDYRLSHLQSLETTYYFPLDYHATEFVQQSYQEFTNGAEKIPGSLHVLGREISLRAVHGDIVLTSFAELCEQPLGPADYLEIARDFSTVIMAGIPKMTPENRNEAKRFVTLIDALYEHSVKLVCSADVPVLELYTQGDGAVEFERTVSRLMEMQSEKYLQSQHVSD